MAKIKDESTPEGDVSLPKRQSKVLHSFGDKEIGSGGKRVRADGVTVNGRDTSSDEGWHTSR